MRVMYNACKCVTIVRIASTLWSGSGIHIEWMVMVDPCVGLVNIKINSLMCCLQITIVKMVCIQLRMYVHSVCGGGGRGGMISSRTNPALCSRNEIKPYMYVCMFPSGREAF